MFYTGSMYVNTARKRQQLWSPGGRHLLGPGEINCNACCISEGSGEKRENRFLPEKFSTKENVAHEILKCCHPFNR